MTLYLPESFEWLILKVGLVQGEDHNKVLDTPSDYVESSVYFSWDQFFAEYFVQNTNGTFYSYSKNGLNRFYTIRNNIDQLVALFGIGN